MKLSVSFLVLLLLSKNVFAGEGADRLNKFTAELQSMKATFTQTAFDENMQQLEVANGEVFLQKPGKFRWNYKKPYQQIIVADGQKVWLHDVDLEQITVKPIGEALGQAPMVLLTSNKPITDEFNIIELGKMNGRYLVQLESKARDTDYGLLLLALSDKGLEVMELKDRLGNVTRVEFLNRKLNSKIDDKIFNFVPPKGIDVIGAQ